MKLKRTIVVATWAYVGWLVLLVSYFWFFSSDGWFITLLLYAPRWPWLVPPATLLPIALLPTYRKWLLAPIATALILVVWPLMGFCVPWRALLNNDGVVQEVRILTLNCGGNACDRGKLLELVSTLQPDIVALQECGIPLDEAAMPGEGWHLHQEQGLVFLSRLPFWHDQTHWRDVSGWSAANAVAYRVDLPAAPFFFINAHLETPREGLEALLQRNRQAIQIIATNTVRRRREAEAVARFSNEREGPAVLAGDLNMPAESAIYRDAFGDYRNAFSDAGWSWGRTKFTRWHAVRIDHILTRGPRALRCWVGPNLGSDHRPLIADVFVAAGT